MIEELRRPLLCFQGWDSVFKVRCSDGLQAKAFLSHPGLSYDVLGSPELELSCATPQTNVAVLLEHKIGGIPKKAAFVFVQSALLYSTLTGQRRVRVSTIALRPSTSIPDIFLSIDFSVFTTMFLRRAVAKLKELSIGKSVKETPTALQREAKDDVLRQMVRVLASYRLYTNASNAPRGQLILPERLQLLPLFGMCLFKSPIFRPSMGKRIGQAVLTSPTNDERAYFGFHASMVGAAASFLLVHPNVFSIKSPLEKSVGEWRTPKRIESAQSELIQASYHSTIQLPPTANASMTCLDEDGVYLIDAGLVIFLSIGKEVNSDVKEELYHLPISLSTSSINQTVTEETQRIRRIVWQMRSFCSVGTSGSRSESRPTFPPVIPVWHGDSRHLLFEQDLMNWMVDDPNGGEKDYTDFLCKLHRLIRDEIDPPKK